MDTHIRSIILADIKHHIREGYINPPPESNIDYDNFKKDAEILSTESQNGEVLTLSYKELKPNHNPYEELIDKLYQVRFEQSKSVCAFPYGFLYDKAYLISRIKGVMPSFANEKYEFNDIARIMNIMWLRILCKKLEGTVIKSINELGYMIPVKYGAYKFLEPLYLYCGSFENKYYFVCKHLCIDDIPLNTNIIKELIYKGIYAKMMQTK